MCGAGERGHGIQHPEAGVLYMNWDEIEGNWKQLKGKVRSQWGKLTDDDVEIVNGKRTELLGIFRRVMVTPRSRPSAKSICGSSSSSSATTVARCASVAPRWKPENRDLT
jgi:uncharacterized protein YjbJ (UPF0337 family)